MYVKIHIKYRSYMFRSSTIIREPALNLAEVIFVLKRSVKLGRYLLCGCVAACHGMVCVLHAVHATHIPFYGMLPHICIINDVIPPNVLT